MVKRRRVNTAKRLMPTNPVEAVYNEMEVIPFERLVHPEQYESLRCGVCLCFPMSPVELKPCQHVFCAADINNWVIEHGNESCPTDAGYITQKDIVPVSRVLRGLVDAALVKCRYNASHEVRMDQLIRHEQEECGCRTVSCHVRGCEAVICASTRQQHMTTCHARSTTKPNTAAKKRPQRCSWR